MSSLSIPQFRIGSENIELYWLAGLTHNENNASFIRAVLRGRTTRHFHMKLLPIGMLPMLTLGQVFSEGKLMTLAAKGIFGTAVIADVSIYQEITSAEIPKALYSFDGNQGGVQRLFKYQTDNGEIFIPTIELTAGAGDWCSAGFLYYLFDLNNNPTPQIFSHNLLSNALKFGQALSSLNCMYDGARGLMRHRSAVYIIRAALALNKDRLGNSELVGELHRMQNYFKEAINKKSQKNKFILDANLCCEPIQFLSLSN